MRHEVYYGEKLGATSETERADGYGGNSYDGEMDYTAMGARWYLPEIGRFISPDPLWAAFPSSSPYVYANNNPLSFKDPSGMAPEKEKAKGNGNKTLEIQTQLNTLTPIYRTEEVWVDVPDVDGTPTMARFFAWCHYSHDQQAERDRLGYFGGFSSVFSSSFGSCDIGSAGGGSTTSNGQGGSWVGGVVGGEFRVALGKGKSLSNYSDAQIVNMLSKPLDYINGQANEGGSFKEEWAFTIATEVVEGITYLVACNFTTSGQLHFVHPDMNTPSSYTIEGMAHTHHSGMTPSDGDYDYMYNRLFEACAYDNIDRNKFMCLVTSCSGTSITTCYSPNNFMDNMDYGNMKTYFGGDGHEAFLNGYLRQDSPNGKDEYWNNSSWGIRQSKFWNK